MADVVIIDASTGEVTERAFTPEELAQRQADEQAWAVIKAAQDLSDANRTTLTDRATTALATNRDFLALASPTNAQTLAQVKALTRQNTAIIRLILNLLDATD